MMNFEKVGKNLSSSTSYFRFCLSLRIFILTSTINFSS